MSQPQSAPVTSNDRLGLTLFLAAAAHAIAILGLGFEAGLAQPSPSPSVEVVMVQTATEDAPDDAARIAQASQQASGASTRENRPTDPLAGPKRSLEAGVAPVAQEAAPARQSNRTKSAVVAQDRAEHKARADRRRNPAEANARRDGPARSQRELQVAQLVAELAERQQRYAKRPRVNYVDSLSAKSAVEAGYLKAWIDKVERIGNLNYPDEARRQRLSGSLVLQVLLDQTGKVIDIDVGRTSGQQVLDDAARRVVELGGPYGPFPAEMREDYDRLMITRTWVFRSDNGLHTE